MKPTMLFLINSIAIERGGLTRASLKQASFFAGLGYETKMVTFNFNPNYPLIRNKLVELDKVHPRVSILNMYEELEGHNEHFIHNKKIQKPKIEQLARHQTYEKRTGHNAFRVYDNGIFIKYISFHKNGSLDFIDYFNENRYRTKREVYDPWGNIKLIDYMDLSLNKPRQRIYFDNDGRAFFTQWNNPKNEKPQRIILFNKDNSIGKQYINDNINLKIDWLTTVVNRLKSKKIVIVSDTRSTDDILLNFEHDKVAKVWRLHSTHLETPYTQESNIAPRLTKQFEQIDHFDAAVFLTEEQKCDVQKLVGEKSNFHVVPHYHESRNSTKKLSLKLLPNRNSKDEKLAIVVSRLSTLKRIEHIIRAFEIVVKEVPDAKLEVWGKGDQENILKEIISELKLDSNVYLMGYTNNPDKVYQKGLFSVLTSKSEGFALSVLESMYNKTPVISYKIKYGPTDMIVDNENGYLIDNKSIDSLANRMIKMFKDPIKAKKMGVNARKYIDQKFNKNIYKEKWLNVIDSAIENKFFKK